MTIGLPMLNVAAMLTIGVVPPIVLISHEQGQGLRVDWQVEKVAGPAPDTARIVIYNLGLVSRKALEAAAALPVPVVVQLSIGWGLVPEPVFTGRLWKVRPSRHVGSDILTEIEAADGALEVRDQPPAGGALVGAAAEALLSLLLLQIGVPPAPSAILAVAEAAAAVPVTAWTGNHVQTGDPRDEIDSLMATLGLSWGIQDGFFVVYRAGLRNDLLPSQLDPMSGLLTAELADDGGVEFEALAQARFVPGLQAVILAPGLTGLPEPLTGGPLRIERVTFGGSTEGPSLMSGIARKVALL